MRTTLNLDEDVLDAARKVAKDSNAPFRQVLNEALRAGLRVVREGSSSRPYRTKPNRMGLREGMNLDNIRELLSRVEGEDSR
ncbi:MAG: DUF2191 domain-containing protein [Acidobacteria bacterium]|nr:DUF2191 domain-containing protein [Acidobacteriota bacterium]